MSKKIKLQYTEDPNDPDVIRDIAESEAKFAAFNAGLTTTPDEPETTEEPNLSPLASKEMLISIERLIREHEMNAIAKLIDHAGHLSCLSPVETEILRNLRKTL